MTSRDANSRPVAWELDESGAEAYTVQPDRGKYLAPSAADKIVQQIFHGVESVSAYFTENDIAVYSKRVDVSIFDRNAAEYFGLYQSDVNVGLPDCCLRHCVWARKFGNYSKVMTELAVVSRFFSSQKQGPDVTAWLNETEDIPLEAATITLRQGLAPTFLDKYITYRIDTQSISTSCEYSGEINQNAYIEQLIPRLAALQDALSNMNAIKPVPGSLRVSYYSQRVPFHI